jgi:hypothetical protein
MDHISSIARQYISAASNSSSRKNRRPSDFLPFLTVFQAIRDRSPTDCPILHVKSHQIDEWLRKLGGAPRTRNSTHTSISTFFSWAKSSSYLPKNEETEAEALSKVKTGDTETEIFTPEQMKTILDAATPESLRNNNQRNGFRTFIPVFKKSLVFRVTTVRPCLLAIAAIWLSRVGTTSPAASH